jgi:predicted DsbA family dithiol-disulfide isomerase
MPVRVRYYTDPACPGSWAAEPQRHALLVEFGNDLPFTYVMGGLARDYEGSHGAQVARWLELAAASRMPFDPRLWTEDPIRTSYPACMAVKAAQEQGPEAAERFLRAARERLMWGRRRLDSAEPLAEVARDAGLDLARFRLDLDSNAIVEAFGSDLEETRSRGVELPALRVGDEVVPAGAPYAEWRAAALAAGAEPSGEPRPDPAVALSRFGRLATVEVEAACDLSSQAAETELWRLAGEGRVRPLRALTGTLWERA